LAAALLWSVNAYAVRYAQEARSYSLVAFLVTVAVYFLVSGLQSGRKRDWNWFVVSSVLAIYAHFFAVLVLVALTCVLWNSAARQELLRAIKRVALFTLPVWIFIATTGTGPISWIPRPNLHGMWMIFGDYVGHGGIALTLLYLVGVLLAAFAAWRLAARQSYRLLLAWFVIPITITFLVSLGKPVLMPRYLFVCIPALVLLVGAGLSSLSWRWIAVPLLAMICWFAMGGVRSYYERDFDLTREDFRDATAYVLAHTAPGDAIVFHKGQNRFAYAYYAHRTAQAGPAILYPGSDHPTWRDFASKVTPQTIDIIRQHHGRVWLLISENMSATGEDAVALQLKHAAAENRELLQQEDFTTLRAYVYSSVHR
jgi:mannosyltransferase